MDVCMCGFCNVWVCVRACGGLQCVGVGMCGFCNVWVCVRACGGCNVWVCVCVGFVMCGCACVRGL